MTLLDALTKPLPTLLGVILGWLLTTFKDEIVGAKLIIDCTERGSVVLIPDCTFIKIRVRNKRSKSAKSCRVYIVSMRKVHGGVPVGPSIINDSFQIKWAGETKAGAGREETPRDIPRGISQYVDLVTFNRGEEEWKFDTVPEFFGSLKPARLHKGIYRFGVMVAGDGTTSKTFTFDVNYEGDHQKAEIWPATEASKAHAGH